MIVFQYQKVAQQEVVLCVPHLEGMFVQRSLDKEREREREFTSKHEQSLLSSRRRRRRRRNLTDD